MRAILPFVVIACGQTLPSPAFVAQPSSALVEVTYPPPPARVEHVPPSPKEGAVWIDGEWTWQGTRWAWKRGRWVIAPQGAAFAPWTTVRNPDGVLYFAEGTWRDVRSGAAVPPPEPLAIARAAPGEVVDAEGDPEKTGRTMRPEGPEAGAGSSEDRDDEPDASIPATVDVDASLLD